MRLLIIIIIAITIVVVVIMKKRADPDIYELIKKVHILQKRILKMSTDMLGKEKQIQDTERLYMSLCEIMSKQPGPDAYVRLSRAQRDLQQRGNKMKV